MFSKGCHTLHIALVGGVMLICGLVNSSFAEKNQSIIPARATTNPLALVERAEVAGEISSFEGSLIRLKYFRDTKSLPDEYTVTNSVFAKCGFGASASLTRQSGSLTTEQQNAVNSASARPSQQTSIVSPLGKFRIHFDTLGVEAVALSDGDVNGIPDYIDRAALYFDSSWTYYHVTQNYLTPPVDNGAGGDDLYDIYFLAIGGYGITIFDGAGPAPWNDFSSYILLRKDYVGFAANQDPQGSAEGALKVSSGHEYFHAVQLAYDGLDDLWLYESSSTWQESALFPEVKDNYQYLSAFYDSPDASLTSPSGFHPYGAFVWPTFLDEQFGDSLMKLAWEKSIDFNGTASLDSALTGWGLSTKKIFVDFTQWNFFTGERFEPGFFSLGDDYLGVPFDKELPAIPFSAETPNIPLDGLGSSYTYRALAGSLPGMLVLEFSGDPIVVWDMTVMLRDSSGAYETVDIDITNSSGTFRRYAYHQWDTLFVIAQVVSPWQTDVDYELTAKIHPYGDADGGGTINIADATYLISYIFSGGAEPKFDIRMGDSNCSGAINISDATYIISYVFSGGAAPCGP